MIQVLIMTSLWSTFRLQSTLGITDNLQDNEVIPPAASNYVPLIYVWN